MAGFRQHISIIFAGIMNRLIILLTLSGFSLSTFGQEKWDLQRCVDYALKNNISVQQADVQARIAALTYQQSKLSQYPSATFQNNGLYKFGRFIDPNTNLFTNVDQFTTNHSLNVNLDLFNWFSKRNTVAANNYQAQAYVAGAEKARNDIALNVANAYLQILLNSEQINISDIQVKQSLDQLSVVQKQVNAGAVPELNLAQIESQLAGDSSTLITTNSNYTLSVLQLKALLNIPADSAFDVAIPAVETIPVESLAELDPGYVYSLAVKNMPQQKINDLNLQAALKNVSAVKGQLYPAFTFFGGLNSFYSNGDKLLGTNPVDMLVPIGKVDVAGIPYTVTTLDTRPVPTSTVKNTYLRQIGNNFNQFVGIGLDIPIFNGGLARTNWKKAQLNVQNVQLQNAADAQTLKQDIYQAHASAMAALQKFNASQKEVQTAQKAYDFARKRFDIGLLNAIDLITTQNNLFRAKINLTSSQYDYVFKMKLLEFYKGQGIKL